MKRQLSFGQALATVIGSVIGAGVFFKIGTITEQTGSASLTLLVWVLAGFISICSGLTVAELASSLQIDGAIQYLSYTYGKVWGFLFGWAQMIIYFPAQIGALAAIFGIQIIALFGLPAHLANWFSVGVIILLLLLNLLGTKLSGRMQSIVTIIKLIPLALIVIFGLFNPHKVSLTWMPLVGASSKPLGQAISSGLLSALFAFEGWIIVTNLASEIKNPKKNLSAAIIAGLSIITLIYLAITTTFLTTLPFHEIVGNQNTAFYASLKLFGPIGGKLVTIGILVSVYGAANGFLLTGMRVPYILAQDNLLPFSTKLSKTNSQTGVPVFSALLEAIICIIMILLGSFNLLSDIEVFVMWSFTIMISFAVIVLRRREPELKRPFKVPLYPVIPIISVLGGIFIVISTFFNQFYLSLVGTGLTLLGLPIYFYHNKKKPH